MLLFRINADLHYIDAGCDQIVVFIKTIPGYGIITTFTFFIIYWHAKSYKYMNIVRGGIDQ